MAPPKYNETDKFKKLKAQWDKKLAQAGFEDLEQEDGNLKSWHSQYFVIRHNETTQQAREDYFRLAGHFLYDYTFENEVDRFIWELHAEGVSLRDTVKQLKKVKIKITEWRAYTLVNTLSKKMLNKNNDRK